MEDSKALVELAATDVAEVLGNLEEMLADGHIDDRETMQLFEELLTLRRGTARIEKVVITQAINRYREKHGYDAPVPMYISRHVRSFEENQARDLCKGKTASTVCGCGEAA